ncbi:helix-turn-helix transcriptional regulator [Pseudomonas sp. 51_B]|uniref:helix-turn-helix domain-containing protein n=1 Tax=Pseudomonas sp. 51_B TaxID=2813573 RepID=UPI001A9ED466|nr:helix-turn-helix transcriptional regulator [Pseudomonas sp. 51_B]
MSLPHPNSPEFAPALKAAREAMGLSYTELAKAVGINPAMPSRYENNDHSCACAPRDSTWQKLNALFSGRATDSLNSKITQAEDVSLAESTVEQIIQELKARGASSVTINY